MCDAFVEAGEEAREAGVYWRLGGGEKGGVRHYVPRRPGSVDVANMFNLLRVVEFSMGESAPWVARGGKGLGCRL